MNQIAISLFLLVVCPLTHGFTYLSHVCDLPGAALASLKVSQIAEMTVFVHTLLFLLDQHERLCIHFTATPEQQRSLKPVFWIEYKCFVRSK